MWHRALAAALCLGACWTGSTPSVEEASAPPPSESAGAAMNMRVKVEHTACFGTCPVYTLVIDGAGRVEWTGQANVATMGRRVGKVTRRELEELSRRLDRAQFFERDNY